MNLPRVISLARELKLYRRKNRLEVSPAAKSRPRSSVRGAAAHVLIAELFKTYVYTFFLPFLNDNSVNRVTFTVSIIVLSEYGQKEGRDSAHRLL